MKPEKTIESKRYRKLGTDLTASIYGSLPPWFKDDDTIIETVGYTVRMSNGTVGSGRKPFKTKKEAQAFYGVE